MRYEEQMAWSKQWPQEQTAEEMRAHAQRGRAHRAGTDRQFQAPARGVVSRAMSTRVCA